MNNQGSQGKYRIEKVRLKIAPPVFLITKSLTKVTKSIITIESVLTL